MFMEADGKKIVLLTGSEGRREIVRRAGLGWLLMSSSFDEGSAAERYDRAAIRSVRAAAEYCAGLSAAKNAGAGALLKRAVVITADTVVFHNKLLEKPRGEAGLYEMIEGLNGRPHEVITAVTIGGAAVKRLPSGPSAFGNEIINYYVNRSMGVTYLGDTPLPADEDESDGSPASVTFAAVSRVLLSGVTRETIKRTIELENPYACSGGYTIDGLLKPYFKILSGTEENIIGLPLSEILECFK
jgi:predicted house-cleaning NTP pyrophosphatase (Maf/HAM1 superfamily)